MMPLANLLALLNIASESQVQITDLAIDSRKVQSGALFFAYPGAVADGRDFIAQAQAAGAVAVLYDAAGFELPQEIAIPAFSVANLQHQVGRIAHEFFGRVCDEMQIFGVTGTNGKTTCCYLLTQALGELGLQAAMIGTCLLYTSPSPRDS